MSIEDHDAYDGDEHCKDCKYWDTYGKSGRMGSCLRYPPQIVALEDFDGAAVIHSEHPKTGEHWWCGEYSPLA